MSNPAEEDDPTIPVAETQVGQDNSTSTPVLTATPTQTPTAPATETPLPTEVALQPTLTPTVPTQTPTSTASNTPSITPLPTQTTAPSLSPTSPPTQTSAPTLTPTSRPTQTTAPSLTPTPFPTATVAPQTYAPPPTFTPVIYWTYTPSPTSVPLSYVCESCEFLNFRATPGTAGDLIKKLDAKTPLKIIGRTADDAWLEVIIPDGTIGWVYSAYVTVMSDLTLVDVTGMAENAQVGAPAVSNNVVSGVSSHARQIFLDGLAKGSIPYAFTRVGDSITASPNFLTPIGQGNYNLADYGYLGGAINFFSGPNGRGANPFSASSVAAHNGWSTESVLNPANASGGCNAGETPLECEYRLTKPAVALIMFGTNDAGGMPSATFRANLQIIVQKSIDMGVIPVLSTIPPKQYNPATDGRIFEFNQIITATARAYDVPLWDYYSAMAVLPDEGLASDGVHPSPASDGLNAVFDDSHLQYGYVVRNLTALQVLYVLWQQVLYDAGQAVPATAVPDAGGAPVVNGDCSLAPPARLVVGQTGYITPGLPNKVRSSPSTGATQVGSIPGKAAFNVIGGPQCSDGYRWWQVNYQGVVGWTASGSGAEYWVRP